MPCTLSDTLMIEFVVLKTLFYSNFGSSPLHSVTTEVSGRAEMLVPGGIHSQKLPIIFFKIRILQQQQILFSCHILDYFPPRKIVLLSIYLCAV